ncbi:MAG: sulfotransferase domain-containing protein [Coxiellaceae bacterium]|nr:sulfotransferase domain-containing protein [Coxiellaceae bacterium]
MTASIVWLASYPKSGNTWFRIFLANLLADKDEPCDINKLEISTPIAASRGLFMQTAGWSSRDLTVEEIRLLQSSFYDVLSDQQTETCYLKTHEAYTSNEHHQFIHSPEATKGTIYFVRNPLDVCISWANHCDNEIDKSIKSLAKDQWIAQKRKEQGSQFAQYTKSWSGHVTSWTTLQHGPTLVMRYEDMLADSSHWFAKAVEFLELEYTQEQIDKALHHARFDELKKQEQAKGFAEKPHGSKAFFRNGKSGDWQDRLTTEQIDKIIAQHHDVMAQYDYLP